MCYCLNRRFFRLNDFAECMTCVFYFPITHENRNREMDVRFLLVFNALQFLYFPIMPDESDNREMDFFVRLVLVSLGRGKPSPYVFLYFPILPA